MTASAADDHPHRAAEPGAAHGDLIPRSGSLGARAARGLRVVALALGVTACSAPENASEAQLGDAATDAAGTDAAGTDAAATDAGAADAGAADAGAADAGAADAGATDAGATDTNTDDGASDADTDPLDAGAPARGRMRLVLLDTTLYPDAVCSDGSPGAFYVQPGVGADANRWVIWFKGGGFCAEEARCRMRTTDLDTVSSTGLPETAAADGILSPDPAQNPGFANWTHVRLHYCSSDRWTGQRADSAFAGLFAGDPTRPFFFRGRFLVDAIVATLFEEAPGRPSLADATDVVLTGSSGGAHGLRANLDRIADMLSPTGATVRGLSDAGLHGYLDPSVETGEDEERRRGYTEWDAALDDSCVAAHASEAWRCFQTALLLEEGHFSTPTFFANDQLDPTEIEALGIRGDPVAVDRFARGVRERLEAHASGAFAPRARNHVIVATGRFDGPRATRIDGRSLSEVFEDWYVGGTADHIAIEAP